MTQTSLINYLLWMLVYLNLKTMTCLIHLILLQVLNPNNL